MRRILIASLVLGLFGSGSQAQGMSDAELLNRLQSQLEATNERTRGLGIVTGGNQGAAGTSTTGEAGLTNLADINSGTVVQPDGTLANRVKKGQEINIQIKFEFDSAALAASEQPALDQMCRVMQQAENIKLFQIIGHTDSSGSEAYNQRLSQLRAEEVGRYLTGTCGIAEARLKLVGYGEEFPDNEGDTRAPENRRVELQVLG